MGTLKVSRASAASPEAPRSEELLDPSRKEQPAELEARLEAKEELPLKEDLTSGLVNPIQMRDYC